MYAMSKAVDKATLLARMIVTDEWMRCSRLDRNIQQRLLWLGIDRGKVKQPNKGPGSGGEANPTGTP